MQKVIMRDELSQYTDHMEANALKHIGGRLTESFEGLDTSDIIALDWYDVNSADEHFSPILIYVDRDDLFFICSDKRSYDKCNELMTDGNTNERALYIFFVKLLSHDAGRLERLEASITKAEDNELRNSRSDYMDMISGFRRELLRLKQYYEDLMMIFDNLTANDNELFTDDGVRRFMIIENRVAHFSANVVNLREYVTQMREACQTQIDIEQNKLMKYFTVIATIFLPLNLIAGWYGMNFKYMPELGWRFGYLGVICLSAAVTVILILWFRKRKWL